MKTPVAVYVRKTAVMGFISLFAIACAHNEKAPKAPPINESPGVRLNAIVTEYSDALKRHDPFFAPDFNVEEDLDKFGDYPSTKYFAREKAMVKRANDRLREIDQSKLSAKDLRLFRLFSVDMQTSMRSYDFPRELMALNQMGNRLHAYVDDSSQELTSFPFDSVKHYDAFLKRSEGFPVYVDRQIDLLRRGVTEKITLSCELAGRVRSTYKDALETKVEKNPFFRPVIFMPKSFADAERTRLTEGFRKMVTERIAPGFNKFDLFYKKEYLPHCRKGFGWSSLPHGREWYEFEVLARTGLNMKPKAIHALGLKEVARIEADVEEIQKDLGFKGDRRAFLKSLTQDKAYFFKSAEEMIGKLNAVRSAVSAKLPEYFSLVPKTDYKIVETSNPEDAAGSYNEPTENVPYGRFIVNAKNLRSIPIYGVTSLSLHETIPGHHFQLALRFEMKDQLSEYQRKMFFSNSFVEGWALYSEYLGNEMGLFKDPMQRLGNRNDDMLRAVRLVVDTGIHELGWSRQRAVDYMTTHLASDANDISNEVNRYAVWPGQALGYKLGQFKIIELRKVAEKELGPKFDIREFHRAVIGNGTVSLSVLEAQVRDYITAIRGH